jgi:hypothetical protein
MVAGAHLMKVEELKDAVQDRDAHGKKAVTELRQI